MKIKVKEILFDDIDKIKPYPHYTPIKQNIILKKIINLYSKTILKKNNFTYQMINMDKLNKNEPCLILMNHSCIKDLAIAFHIFKKRQFNIITTDDGFIGKTWFMRHLGCVATKKFIPNPIMVEDIICVTKKLNRSILIYPEAGYSFDGRSAIIPLSLAKLIKFLKIPVVTIITDGVFLSDPLYNDLQNRKVDISAKVTYAFNKDEIEAKSVEEIDNIIKSYFSFNNFKSQIERKVIVDEPFRADKLNRVLYLCPHCHKEGYMVGKGTTIKCTNCNNEYELTTIGKLKNLKGETLFETVYDWYDYEKAELEKEIKNGTYHLEVPVDIYVLRDFKALYHVGEGKLFHNKDGFKLNGCNGKINYSQPNDAYYTINCDFYWYEIGDLICIGNDDMRYYCIIKGNYDVASKTKLAVEILYRLLKNSAK